jgi:hypothetical protein
MNEYPPTPATTLERYPDRGSYDRDLIASILDEGLVGTVGFVDGAQPFAIPTTYARLGDAVYLHGSHKSRMWSVLRGGARTCFTVTLLDGLVLARSAFHHSMNYRSVVVLGAASEVTDEPEKRRAFDALVEKMAPGRSRETRPANAGELAATVVLKLVLNEVSAKVRAGPPVEAAADLSLPHWGGVIPVAVTLGAPEPDANVRPGVQPPRPRAAR